MGPNGHEKQNDKLGLAILFVYVSYLSIGTAIGWMLIKMIW